KDPLRTFQDPLLRLPGRVYRRNRVSDLPDAAARFFPHRRGSQSAQCFHRADDGRAHPQRDLPSRGLDDRRRCGGCPFIGDLVVRGSGLPVSAAAVFQYPGGALKKELPVSFYLYALSVVGSGCGFVTQMLVSGYWSTTYSADVFHFSINLAFYF